jgi:hypothetical protein
MRYCFLQLRERGKMTNYDPTTDPQLQAIKQVLNEIMGGKVPLVDPYDLFTKKVIRELEEQKHNYLIDDGDLCSVIDMAIIELRSARAMLTQMREELHKQDTKIAEQYTEIQRLERLAANVE